MEWFNTTYCDKCEPIECHYTDKKGEPWRGHTFTCGWCELNDNTCKHFPDLDHIPDNKEIIKMWLNLDVTESEGE